MKIEWIEIFLDVVNCKSFSQVALNRGINVAKVSRYISSLEDSIGVKLFNRNTRSIILTDNGLEFYNKIDPILVSINDIKSSLNGDCTALKGTIRLTAPTSYHKNILLTKLNKFSELYPEINLEVVVTDYKLDLYKEKIDIAIRLGELKNSSLIASRLHSMKYVCCASPDYLQKFDYPQKPENLVDHNCLFFPSPDNRSKWSYKKDDQISFVNVKGRLLMTDISSLIYLVLQDVGVLLAPDWSVNEYLEDGRLVELFHDYKMTNTSYNIGAWIVYISPHKMSYRVRLFIDFLKKELSSNTVTY